MSATYLVTWLVAAMNMMAPAHREHFTPEARESYAQADERYEQIATAIVRASFDSAEEPLFGGKFGRERTALFVAAKFYHESGFRRDIQYGTGRARYRRHGLNDFGRSWCLGQINLGVRGDDSSATTAEGWTGKELLSDIDKCVVASLHMLRRSMAACSGGDPDHRLAAYASGACDNETGKTISKRRFVHFRRLWARARLTM